MDVHILRGIILSGIFLPRKDEMAQTTHIILDSIPWLLSKYKSLPQGGWSGGAMVLGKLPVPGRPTIWITVGQGPTALTVGAGGGLFGHFYSPLSYLSSFSLSLGDGPI